MRSLARLVSLFVGGCLVFAAVGICLFGLAIVLFGAGDHSMHFGLEMLILSVLVAAVGLGAIVAAVALIPFADDTGGHADAPQA